MREIREYNLPALYADEDEWIRLRCRLIEESEEEDDVSALRARVEEGVSADRSCVEEGRCAGEEEISAFRSPVGEEGVPAFWSREEARPAPAFCCLSREKEKKPSFLRHFLIQTAVSAALVLTFWGLRSWVPELAGVCQEVQEVLSQDFLPVLEEGVEAVIAAFHG